MDESQGINPTGFGNSLNDTLKDNRVKKKTNVIRRHPSKVDVPHEIDHRFGFRKYSLKKNNLINNCDNDYLH